MALKQQMDLKVHRASIQCRLPPPRTGIGHARRGGGDQRPRDQHRACPDPARGAGRRLGGDQPREPPRAQQGSRQVGRYAANGGHPDEIRPSRPRHGLRTSTIRTTHEFAQEPNSLNFHIGCGHRPNMSNHANPFRPGSGLQPPYLAGRDEELTRFPQMLQEIQEGQVRNLMVQGLRGVGKTVLLRVRQYVRRQQIPPCYAAPVQQQAL